MNAMSAVRDLLDGEHGWAASCRWSPGREGLLPMCDLPPFDLLTGPAGLAAPTIRCVYWGWMHGPNDRKM